MLYKYVLRNPVSELMTRVQKYSLDIAVWSQQTLHLGIFYYDIIVELHLNVH